jgi:protein-L-isoaspartate O-methyltransferase
VRHHPETSLILELGSGTGIHASLLADKGFMVHGIERSLEMMARAQVLAEKGATEVDLWLSHVVTSARFD